MDAAGGGTAASPWRTLQYAADRVQAGDTVIVRAGSYVGFDLRTGGTAASRITFAADPGVTITQRNVRTPDGINLEGADYITVQGFTVVGMPRTGIRTVLNRGVTIQGNTCDRNGYWGILSGFSDDLLIQNNVTTRSAAEHGIYVSNSGDRPTVRGNVSWGNRSNGLHMNGDIELGGDGIISNALVENNVFYDNGTGGGSGINCDGVQNSVIRNNLIYNTHASGISLYRINGGGGSTGNLVVNNTVLVSATGRWALNITDGSTGNTVRNNILYSAHSFRGAITVSTDSLAGFVSNFNLTEDRFSTDGGDTVMTLAQWRAATGQDTNSFTTANPGTLFVNAAGSDYHLAAGSVAIDKGTITSAPPTDAEGTARPTGTGVDIGHDEFAGTSPPPPPPPPPPPVTGSPFAVGTDVGAVARVTFFNADRTIRFTATPFGATYTGGVRVAVGDVTGDGVPDVVAVTEGVITTSRAVVLNGVNGKLVTTPALVPPTYTGQLSVSLGDVNGDGKMDIGLGSNEGGPRARVYRGGDFVKLADFRAASGTGFLGRTQIALGDMTGDGKAEVVLTARYSDGTRVYGYKGAAMAGGVAVGTVPATAFNAFTLAGVFLNGAHVAVGDVNGDGFGDLVLGTYQASTSAVQVYSGKPLTQTNTRTKIADFSPAGSSGGRVRVAVRDVDGDGKADLLTSSGELVTAFKGGPALPTVGRPPVLFAFDPFLTATGAVWVG